MTIKSVVIFLITLLSLSTLHVNAQSMATQQHNTLLVLDEDFGLEIPKNFRTSLQHTGALIKELVNEEGLDKIKIAGSAQFSEKTLKNALLKMEGAVWIVDLRQESHGFVNGIPISWYSNQNQSNIGESDDNIQRLESMLFRDFSKQRSILINKILDKKEGIIQNVKGIDIKIENAGTEVSLLSKLNLGYIRIGVLDHHAPTDTAVDTFLSFIKDLPEDSWIYFHCRGGKGRTTTFMVMTDILRNASQVSLEDIVKRQAAMGGSDLFNISTKEDSLWKANDAMARKEFITQFYKYATHRKGYPKYAWSEWKKRYVK